MRISFDINENFGIPKESHCKNINRVLISIHPEFFGIYLCYQEAFKSLKTNLSILDSSPKICVWKDPNIPGYTVANTLHWYLYWSKNKPNNLKLFIYSFPNSPEKLDLLKKITSQEFINFLSSFPHEMDKLNPKKLQNLINTHISPEIILALNKEKTLQAHHQMSLDLLATLLSTTRNKFNYRNKIIEQDRQNVFAQLEQTSEIVKKLVNNADYLLSPEQLWGS